VSLVPNQDEFGHEQLAVNECENAERSPPIAGRVLAVALEGRVVSIGQATSIDAVAGTVVVCVWGDFCGMEVARYH
jgi:hypothetical protein